MRRFLNPTVAVTTFFIGVFSASMWFIVQHQGLQRPEVLPVPLSASSIPPQINPETEKYAVYSAIIKDMYAQDRIKLLVIGRETGCVTPSNDEKVEEMRSQMEAYAVKELPELKQETLDDFRIKAKGCHSLDKQLDIPIKYVLVTDKEIEPLFPKGELDGGWRRFYSKYPDSSGIIGFSNVGFNHEMNQALVATSNSCGGLCGAGYYVLLTKDNGVWKVHSKTMTWVS